MLLLWAGASSTETGPIWYKKQRLGTRQSPDSQRIRFARLHVPNSLHRGANDSRQWEHRTNDNARRMVQQKALA